MLSGISKLDYYLKVSIFQNYKKDERINLLIDANTKIMEETEGQETEGDSSFELNERINTLKQIDNYD